MRSPGVMIRPKKMKRDVFFFSQLPNCHAGRKADCRITRLPSSPRPGHHRKQQQRYPSRTKPDMLNVATRRSYLRPDMCSLHFHPGS